MSLRNLPSRARWARFTFVLASVLLAPACMSSPRNGQHLSDTRSEVAFGGRVIVSGQRVDVSIQNRRTGAWEYLRSFTASTTAYVDSTGTSWYEWSGSARLPTASQYWTLIPGAPADGAFSHMRASVRATSADGTQLDTFDLSADDCGRAHWDEGIMSVIQNCRSASTPVVTMTASCGSRGLGCCMYGACQPGLVCSAGGECVLPAPPVSYTAVGDYPFQSTVNWAEHPQGLAHDDGFWYATYTNDGDRWIGFSPIEAPLDRDLPVVHLAAAAPWDHYGDPDVFRGRVYIPLEGGPGPTILSVDAIDLRTRGDAAPGRLAALVPGSHAAWVAINPTNGRLYTASSYEWVNSVDEYDMVDNASGLSLTLRRRIPLTGDPHLLRRVQGGAFGPEGTMYLVSWSENEAAGGVHVFDSEGRFRQRIHVAYDDPNEILEGIDVADMDDGRSPGIAGDIHVAMYQWRPSPWSNRLYVKHFRSNY